MATAAILFSLACIAYLAVYDPKRRRAFGLASTTPPVPARAVWVACVIPALPLALGGHSAAFVMWLAATSTFGWLVVLVSPQTYSAAVEQARRAFRKVYDRLPRP